jgi:hypothetical protein
LLSIGIVAGSGHATLQQGPLPATFDAYLTNVARLGASERNSLMSGAPVTKLLDADPTKEVAVFGAVWVRALPAAYVERVKDIEHFESGGAFRITKRISSPPRLADFDQLELLDDDLADLQRCRIGNCELKLSASALRTMREEVDWKKPTAKADAIAVFRRLAFEYVNGYQEQGDAALAVYRDKDRPTFVANELRTMIDRLPSLATYLPDLRRYLLEYPHAPMRDATDFLYWQETQFGLKPTIRISHLVIQPRADSTVVASKMLYSSHYFWTALELRILLPDPARGPGFWLITINRSRSDGLSGFMGRVVRGRVRSEVQLGTLAVLTATKTRLEKSVR